MDVGANALAESRLEEMGGGVIALGRVPCEGIHPRHHRLARAQRTLLEDHGERLVFAEAKNVLDTRTAVALLAFDRPHVADLAAAGRVERRLGELDEIFRHSR